MKKARKKEKAKPVPKGYGTVTPYLACGDAARAIEFYKRAFGAKEVMRMSGHADRRIPVQDKFSGDRTGTVQDPFGHVWHIATHVEDLSVAGSAPRRQ